MRGGIRTYGGVVDVVVGSDHAQVERREVHLVFYSHTLGLLQVRQSVLHQLRQVVREVTMGHTCEGEKERERGVHEHLVMNVDQQHLLKS